MSRRRRPSRAVRFPLDRLEERASSAALLPAIATPMVLAFLDLSLGSPGVKGGGLKRM